MFRASSAHLQEDTVVYKEHMVPSLSIRVLVACHSGKALRITYSECVCNLRYPACNAHASYRHLWPLSLYHIFAHYFITGTIFGKKFIEHKMCVLYFLHGI